MSKNKLLRLGQNLGILVGTLGFYHYGDKFLESLDNGDLINLLKGKTKEETDKLYEDSLDEVVKPGVDSNVTSSDASNVSSIDSELVALGSKFKECKQLADVLSTKVQVQSECLDQVKDSLGLAQVTVGKISDIINKKYPNGFSANADQITTELSAEVNKLTTNLDEMSDVLQKITKSSILPDITEITTEFNKFVEMYFSYLDTLSMGEEALFLNIIFDIVMLLTALNITSVFFGNELIKYLEIEKRFPKLSKVMRLRTIYQRYYLAWSMFIFIIANLLSIFLCVTGFILNK